MGRVSFLFILMLSVFLVSCAAEGDTAEKSNEKTGESTNSQPSIDTTVEKLDTSESKSAETVPSATPPTDPKTQAREAYLAATKEEMDRIYSEMVLLWDVRLVDQLPEEVYDEAWSTTLMDSAILLLDDYEELATSVEQIPTEGLGRYEDYVHDYQMAILESLEARILAIAVLNEASRFPGGILSYLEDFNEHSRRALLYQKEAALRQESLEDYLGLH